MKGKLDLTEKIPLCEEIADAMPMAADEFAKAHPGVDLHPDAFAQYQQFVQDLCGQKTVGMGMTDQELLALVFNGHQIPPAPVFLPEPGLLLALAIGMLLAARR